MMAIMDKITDKPDWDKKVFDDAIVQKWRLEALATEDVDVSEKMLDWCVAELRDKARFFQCEGMIPTLDLDAAVIKSDTAISSDLKESLRGAAACLEAVPNRLKDWHPGSDGKVLDLVHPSLFPLIYGRSRVLSSGRLDLQDCVASIGKGEIATTPEDTEVEVDKAYELERTWVTPTLVSGPKLSSGFPVTWYLPEMISKSPAISTTCIRNCTPSSTLSLEKSLPR